MTDRLANLVAPSSQFCRAFPPAALEAYLRHGEKAQAMIDEQPDATVFNMIPAGRLRRSRNDLDLAAIVKELAP